MQANGGGDCDDGGDGYGMMVEVLVMVVLVVVMTMVEMMVVEVVVLEMTLMVVLVVEVTGMRIWGRRTHIAWSSHLLTTHLLHPS